MIALDLEITENTMGGGFLAGACIAIGASSIIYAVGGLAVVNFWNPVGWAVITFIVADTACIVYGASKL